MTSVRTLAQFNALAGAYADQLAEAGIEEHETNAWLIQQMNAMYELPINEEPTLNHLGKDTAIERITKFMATLQGEVDEGKLVLTTLVFLKEVAAGQRETVLINEALAAALDHGFDQKDAEKYARALTAKIEEAYDDGRTVQDALEVFAMVQIADWLNDIKVFCDSEGLKFGIPMDAVFKLIMASNFTKLGADGKPIKDGNGKFLKGPNYIAPEEHIEALLFNAGSLLDEYQEMREELQDYESVTVPILDTMPFPMASTFDEDEQDVVEDEGEEA